MSVGRNDLCPCASGKKYKHCCLVKETSSRLKQQRREKFYEEKQALVEEIGDFLVQQIPLNQYNELKDEFTARTKKRIDEEIEEGYFTFWLYFFHRFENGLRGIEWFYKENVHKLHEDVKEMTEHWINMKARFLQAIDKLDEVIIFEDLRSKEKFPLSNDEDNVVNFYPWMSTIALIEKFDDSYYFNGFRFIVPPYNIQNVMNYLEQLISEKQQPESEIIIQYFPELIAKLFESPVDQKHLVDVIEYSLTYTLSNIEKVSEYLRNQSDIRMEEIEKNKQEFVWAGNWRICKDNACPSEIRLADVYGNLFLQNNTLIYVGIEEDKQQAMKQRLLGMEDNLILEKEEKKVIGSYPSKPNNILVMIDEMIPDYFTFYAQNNLMKEIDEPIPMYEHKTLRELIQIGHVDPALEWLKNLEFNVYRQVINQYNKVEITADFNSVRRELGLELSPFVTGGSNRKTTYHTVNLA